MVSIETGTSLLNHFMTTQDHINKMDLPLAMRQMVYALDNKARSNIKETAVDLIDGISIQID